MEYPTYSNVHSMLTLNINENIEKSLKYYCMLCSFHFKLERCSSDEKVTYLSEHVFNDRLILFMLNFQLILYSVQ